MKKEKGKYILGLAIIFAGLLFVNKSIEIKIDNKNDNRALNVVILQFIKEQQRQNYKEYVKFLMEIKYHGSFFDEKTYLTLYSLLHT